MKKLFVLVAIFTTVFMTNANAQGGGQGGDPAARMQAFKDRVKPQLIEKTKITANQAEKVLDIQMAHRTQMRGMKDLSEDDRKKKMNEINADINKQYKALSLTDDQIKSVNDFFEDMRKQMQQRMQNGGGNGSN